ncbi:MAG: hypothetical protein ACFHWX_11120 [Bacteroidota bacterium]
MQEPATETHFTGVYQGKVLFIQNPYDPSISEFCIKELYVNGSKKDFNPKLSAIILEFEKVDLFTPVTIKIIHKDSCNPIILNPDAIFFHSTFNFQEIVLSDSLLTWHTIADKPGAQYVVERYMMGIWDEVATIESKGIYSGADYEFSPAMEEGPNKFRIKYIFPDNKYLYSREIDYHFYPDPVTFSPKSTKSLIKFSRNTSYKIYNPQDSVVLEGVGSEVDVRRLWKGQYVIYFDGKDPGTFTKE